MSCQQLVDDCSFPIGERSAPETASMVCHAGFPCMAPCAPPLQSPGLNSVRAHACAPVCARADHLRLLEDMQAKGQLGCFALTEKLAGVNSGLVVETTATWDQGSQTFELNTPYPGAAKNWISQGVVADYAVVMASLVMGGKNLGPHAFVMQAGHAPRPCMHTPAPGCRWFGPPSCQLAAARP